MRYSDYLWGSESFIAWWVCILYFKNETLIFMSSSMKDFLDKFFDLCREYQQEIPPQKMAEVLREYADRLDEF